MRIDLAYDGTEFHGWQTQPGLRTVQGELAGMVSRLLGWGVMPIGAGRTDTGVHALSQTAHVGGLTPQEADRLVRVLPRHGQDDLEILRVRLVARDFNARYSALWRRYHYRLAWDRNIWERHRAWRIDADLDHAAMIIAAEHLLGRHDYRSFCKTSSCKQDNHCQVDVAGFEWHDDGAVFVVQANRFLHHMVRMMVGTLVEIGRGNLAVEDIRKIIDARDRREVKIMAPPQGLYLMDVGYPDELLNPGHESDDQTGAPGVQTEETP